MLAAVMENQQSRQLNGSSINTSESSDPVNSADNEDFYSSGRTGRRNALPDILGEHAHVTSSDLPARLQALSTKSDQEKLPTGPDPEAGPSSRSPS